MAETATEDVSGTGGAVSPKIPGSDAPAAGRPRTLVATDRVGKYFPVRGGFFSRNDKLLRAVDGVSIRVRR